MNTNEIGVLISIVVPIFLAIAGYCMAQRKNRMGWLWAIICLFSGLLGLIVVGCSKPLDYDEELDYKENETLGWVMLVIAIIWLGITIWFGWSAAKSYHNQMMWNYLINMSNR